MYAYFQKMFLTTEREREKERERDTDREKERESNNATKESLDSFILWSIMPEPLTHSVGSPSGYTKSLAQYNRSSTWYRWEMAGLIPTTFAHLHITQPLMTGHPMSDCRR